MMQRWMRLFTMALALVGTRELGAQQPSQSPPKPETKTTPPAKATVPSKPETKTTPPAKATVPSKPETKTTPPTKVAVPSKPEKKTTPPTKVAVPSKPEKKTTPPTKVAVPSKEKKKATPASKVAMPSKKNLPNDAELVLPAAAPLLKADRRLPGVQADGKVLLPNQWSIKPAGRQLAVGDFPVNMALHPSGRWLAILHAGFAEHEVMVVDLEKNKVCCRIPIAQAFYGICFSPDGKQLFASGSEQVIVHGYTFADGLLSNHRAIRAVVDLPDGKTTPNQYVVGGLAVSPDGSTLAAALPWGDGLAMLDIQADNPQNDIEPRKPMFIHLPVHGYPYACLFEPKGRRLFISLWNSAGIAVVDTLHRQIIGKWNTEAHPTEMVLSPDGQTLYVACANSTKVSVLETKNGRALQTIHCALYPQAPTGNTPNSLALTPDGQLLMVANADANNITVLNVAEPGKAKPMGFIPVGWYPTSVRYNPVNKRIYVANGKGMTSRANPQGPNPEKPARGNITQYIARLYQGTLSILDIPTPAQMRDYSLQAYACSPLRADLGAVAERDKDNPIPAKVGDSSPVKHCIYIIKENRTYDQVFGDMPEGNGDPALCLFPEKITPNHHRLARQFVLLDNFYVDGEVSADGHEWSMGAYATDYVEKVWPLSYRGGKIFGYPSEGSSEIAQPAGGYIWDRCAEARVTYRSYGEWVRNADKVGDPGTASAKSLEGHFDPLFRSYDLDYPDALRADRFLTELARFEQEGAMPRFIVLRLPNDHTYGTRPGKPTPTAMVADNDLALGRVVEGISKSKFWKDTAIFVVEDDAQNGPDHVDAHRTVALVISPYTKKRFVDSAMYSTTSMLRTMELILGLKPMSQFDAAARPMYNSFQSKPDFTGYVSVVPQTDMKALNAANAWGAAESLAFDLSKEDAADDLRFNEVIWRSVKGAESPMPAPVRAAFFVPRMEEDDDDEEGKD